MYIIFYYSSKISSFHFAGVILLSQVWFYFGDLPPFSPITSLRSVIFHHFPLTKLIFLVHTQRRIKMEGIWLTPSLHYAPPTFACMIFVPRMPIQFSESLNNHKRPQDVWSTIERIKRHMGTTVCSGVSCLKFMCLRPVLLLLQY